MKKNKVIIPAVALFTVFIMSSCERETVPSIMDSNRSGFSVKVEKGNDFNTKGGAWVCEGKDSRLMLNMSVSPTVDETVATKGTPIESEEAFLDTFESFTVWGYSENGTTRKALTELHNKQVTKYGKKTYSPVDKDGNHVNYFPLSTKVTNGQYAKYFYALARYSEQNIAYIGSAWDYLQFRYTMPAPNTTDNRDAEAQKEIFVGTVNGQITDNEIPMSFKHVLAKIRFIVGDINKDITINKITLPKINSVGTCKIDKDGNIIWNSLGTQKTYVQTFDFGINTESEYGTEINDSDKSMSFLVIPQTLANDSRIKIEYTDIYGSHSYTYACEPGMNLQAGNTYTFTINTFAYGDAWIDFPGWTKGGGGDITVGDWVADEYINFSYPQIGGQYEKFNIPIHGLIEGLWYELAFAEGITKQSGKQYFNYDSKPTGSYACRVDAEPTTSHNRESQLGWYDGNNDSNTWSRYIWMLDGVKGKNDYTPTYDVENQSVITPLKILFKATAETMYWNWDFSLTADGTDIHDEIHKISITPLVPATGPAVDFINASHYGFWHAGEDNTTGYSTFKTYATYNYLEFHARSRDGSYERMNIPLINLEAGHRYRICFTFERERGSNGTSAKAYFGYRVASAPVENGKEYVPVEEDDFQNKTNECTDAVFSITESYEFDATDETMYWIWEMSRLKNLNLFFFKDVTIEDITPAEQP